MPKFTAIDLQIPEDTLQHLKSFTCVPDVLPTHFLKEVFCCLGADLLQIDSTKNALIKVLNDICMNTDAGIIFVLVLLDLCAAFDTHIF